MSEVKNINIDLSKYTIQEVEDFLKKLRMKNEIDDLEKSKRDVILSNPSEFVQ